MFDLGTGTATSGSNFASFAPQRGIFAAGSAPGTTTVVLLDPLDDDFVDAPGESVELGLRAGIGGEPDGATLILALADSDTARVSFATPSGSSLEADAGQVALEFVCEAGVTLQVDAGVRVSDLGTGTAVLLTDYAIFPSRRSPSRRAARPAPFTDAVELALAR